MTSHPHRPITLVEVAEAAGVSVSTASRAINGRGQAYRISEKTVQRVRAEAERLGFSPNQVAKSLQSSRSRMIGVLVPDLSNPFFGAIARQVTTDAEADGYSVLIADTHEQIEKERDLAFQMRGRQVEGLVVCPVGTDFGHLETLHQSGFPMVLVDRTQSHSELVGVTSDHAAGATKGTRHLLSAGHRHLACLQGIPGTQPNDERLGAIRSSLESAGLRLPDDRIAGTDFTEQSGYDATMCVMERSPETTALFALSSPIAMGALDALAELGKEVPIDVSLITFGEVPYARWMKTPLSVIAQDIERLGHTAARLLIKRLTSKRRPRRTQHIVPVRWIGRQSISAPRRACFNGANP